jgi:membrane protein
MTFLRDTFAVIKATLLDLERKHLHLAAAGLAYYLLLSFLPALVLVTAVVSYLPVRNGVEVAISFLRHLVPQLNRVGTPVIEQMLSTVSSHRGGLLSFGLIGTLWLTSKGVKGIIAGLDMVYEVERPRRVWTNGILAFGLAFGVALLLLLATALMLTGPTLESLLSELVPVQSLWIRIWPYVQWSIIALFTFAAVEMLYVLAPNVPLRKRVTVPGALVAAFIWMALSWGISLFVLHFGWTKLDKFYGAMATPIALAIWLNWGALGMLTGAEINLNIQSLRSEGEDGIFPASRHV